MSRTDFTWQGPYCFYRGRYASGRAFYRGRFRIFKWTYRVKVEDRSR